MMSAIVDSPMVLGSSGTASSSAGFDGANAPPSAASAVAAASGAPPADVSHSEDVYNNEYNQFMVSGVPGRNTCERCCDSKCPPAPLFAFRRAAGWVVCQPGGRRAQRSAMRSGVNSPLAPAATTQQVCGSLFECPAKYAPIKPIGRGAYGVVW